MSLTHTVNKIIELSSVDNKKSDSNIVKSDFFACSNDSVLFSDEFSGKIDEKIFLSDKISITKEEYIEYEKFTQTKFSEDYIHPTWSEKKILQIFKDFLYIHDSRLDGIEIFTLSRYKPIGGNKELFADAVFYLLNQYFDAWYLPNESDEFIAYSIYKNIDSFGIKNEEVKKYLLKNYHNKKIEDIEVRQKGFRLEEFNSMFTVNDPFLKLYSSGIFHIAKLCNSVEEIEKLEIFLTDLYNKDNDIGKYIGRLVRYNILDKKINISDLSEILNLIIKNKKVLSGAYYGMSSIFEYILQSSNSNIELLKKVLSFNNKTIQICYSNKLDLFGIIEYLEVKNLSIDIINEYFKIFITEEQQREFNLKWYLDLSQEEREFIKQAINHFKIRILKTNRSLDCITKKSKYLLDIMNLEDTKDDVLKILESDRKIPKLKEIFKEKYSVEIYKNNDLLLDMNEKVSIKKISDFIVNNSSIDDKVYFDKIDTFLKEVLLNLEKYNQQNTDSYKLITTYLEYDIDNIGENEEIVLLTLLVRHFKNKKIQSFLIELLFEKIFKNSKHIYEFFVESKQDNLDYNKYISTVLELVDEFNEQSKIIEKSAIGSKINFSSFLTKKDKKKLENTGEGISLSKEVQKIFIQFFNLNSVIKKMNLLEEQKSSDLKEKINIYGVKNEIDLSFSSFTCVSSKREELFNNDFIPLRITNDVDNKIIGYIWLKEANITGIGKVLVLTDIQPIMDYRGYFEPYNFYENIKNILHKYKQKGGYSELVLTTANGTQSNDSILAKTIRKDFKNKVRLKLDRQIFLPVGTSYDISEVVII